MARPTQGEQGQFGRVVDVEERGRDGGLGGVAHDRQDVAVQRDA
jgi:hypothetical protein